MSICSFTVIPMEEIHGRQICGWRYPPPYDIYHWPSWEMMLAGHREFADPAIRAEQYAAVVNETGSLCGYAQFFPIAGVTRLGLGMHPDLCGQGYGTAFVQVIAAEARKRKPEDEIDLEVFTWNARAIRVYEKAGFAISDTYEKATAQGTAMVHCMVWSEKS